MAYKFRMPGGPTTATTGATRWVAGTHLQHIGYASNDDLTSWTFYNRMGSGTPDAIDLAYGKDASGNAIYCCTNDSSNKEVSVSTADVTDGNAWTHIDLDTGGNDQFVIKWTERSNGAAAGVWVTVGKQDSNKSYYRSIDGAANWSEISLNGITGHTTDRITALAGDGSGNWMMGQNDRIYYSTDDAASFSLVHTFTGENITKISGMAYTGATWVISYERSNDSGKTYLRSCAASDVTDWGNEFGGGDLQNYDTGNSQRTTIVAYQGRILVQPHHRFKVAYADVSGKTISNFNVVNLVSLAGTDKLKDAATDGTKWLICGQDGILLESTDSAENWSVKATGIQSGNVTDDITCIVGNVHLPL